MQLKYSCTVELNYIHTGIILHTLVELGARFLSYWNLEQLEGNFNSAIPMAKKK